MKIQIKVAVGALLVTGALVMFAVTGCAPSQPQQPHEQNGRYQVVGVPGALFLLDTQRGDAWVYVNTVWINTPKGQLPPEVYNALLNSAFQRIPAPPGAGTATPTGTGTPPAPGTPMPK
jgi:hypothetical protein